jgi:hypothetical protein
MNNRGEFGTELLYSQAEGPEKFLQDMKRQVRQKYKDVSFAIYVNPNFNDICLVGS